MEGKRFIHSLRLKNLLSYGSEGEKIELQPLNVLIGANASGKSNLIEAIALLQAAPKNLATAIRKGGGISNWLWKGTDEIPIAEIEVVVDNSIRNTLLKHQISFTQVNQTFEILEEKILGKSPRIEWKEIYFYSGEISKPRFTRYDPESQKNAEQEEDEVLDSFFLSVNAPNINRNNSILSQIKGASLYPFITFLGDEFNKIRLYREWILGRNSEPRKPRQTDEPNDFLEEDASNLALVINNLQNQPKVKRLLLEKFRQLYEAAEDISTRVEGGTVQLFVHEEGLNHPIPATRLSDGTLRYLCLLAILCHPTPPPLICIEEPELGLHPDVLPTIAQLLQEASQRTQLIVTTHSDALISALPPEAVLVCERDENGTHLKRLDSEKLRQWLEDYALGDLWRMGELGGTRW